MEKNNFRKIATITLFESAVQWYCFLLYGTAAGTVFNKVFFSQTGNGTTALILSYMSFAIGYIAGPFGAIFFGHIGDRKGRKVTMYASLCSDSTDRTSDWIRIIFYFNCSTNIIITRRYFLYVGMENSFPGSNYLDSDRYPSKR